MILNWHDNQDVIPVSEAIISQLEQLLELVAQSEQIDEGEVALTFVNDAEIKALNAQFRSIDEVTDVLSFPQHEGDEAEVSIHYDQGDGEAPIVLFGDIVISVNTAKRQSEQYGHSYEREIAFLFIHGFLHLLGYDHESEAEEREMFAKQEQILQKAGLTR